MEINLSRRAVAGARAGFRLINFWGKVNETAFQYLPISYHQVS
jgi:hypothetical protein